MSVYVFARGCSNLQLTMTHTPSLVCELQPYLPVEASTRDTTTHTQTSTSTHFSMGFLHFHKGCAFHTLHFSHTVHTLFKHFLVCDLFLCVNHFFQRAWMLCPRK